MQKNLPRDTPKIRGRGFDRESSSSRIIQFGISRLNCGLYDIFFVCFVRFVGKSSCISPALSFQFDHDLHLCGGAAR